MSIASQSTEATIVPRGVNMRVWRSPGARLGLETLSRPPLTTVMASVGRTAMNMHWKGDGKGVVW